MVLTPFLIRKTHDNTNFLPVLAFFCSFVEQRLTPGIKNEQFFQFQSALYANTSITNNKSFKFLGTDSSVTLAALLLF